MSEHKHTPEPWATSGETSNSGWVNQIINSTCEIVSSKSLSESNARRIVACVNVCAGITTDKIERSKSLEEFMRSMAKIEKQRDELLTICRNVVERGIGASDVNAMKAAIASTKDGK